ncbi:MAG: hypothetical protein EZS28_016793, partial [Streblomastix strix]
MIPSEKPDIIYLLKEPAEDVIFNYKKFNVRIVNMQNAAVGDVTATKFIKTGGTVNDMLLANGDTKAISYIVGNYVDLATNQTIYGIKTADSIKKTN